jgi:uncharacterized protein (DUF885 family)
MPSFRLLAASSLCVFASALACAQAPAPDTSAQLKALLDEDLDAVLRRNPFQATTRGIPGYDDLLPDYSKAGLEREHGRQRRALERVRALERAKLRGQEHVSHELLEDKLRRAVEGQRFRDAEALALSTLGGVQSMMPRGAQVFPFRTTANYRDYTKRLEAMPKAVDDLIERLRDGLKSGWMSTTPVLDRVVAAIDSHLVDDATNSVLMEPFKRFSQAVPAAEREALAAAARRAIADDYQPALRRMKAFIVTEYRPKAPAEAGLGAFPGGEAYYEYLIRSRILPGYTAKEIHEYGLAEVKRLRAEIGAIAKEVGFAGTTDEFIHYVRTDPRFFFKSTEDVLAAYRAMSARVDPQLPKLFRHVPRMPYAVRAMSPAEAASSTAANYQIGSLVLGTSGYFTLDAADYAHQPTWEVETLFLHEAVPGHHMQGARAAEIEGLPRWRTVGGGYNIAYGEGWALYAETLGYALGFYKDPYQRYGHLQAELFRAARLVVDTGIHAFKWPRERAIAFMQREGATEEKFAVSEVDRYFSNPSQALGYKLGLRRILELRRRAESALGTRFDVRDFHAVLLDNGPMPLPVVEKLVDEWIAGARGPKASPVAGKGSL